MTNEDTIYEKKTPLQAALESTQIMLIQNIVWDMTGIARRNRAWKLVYSQPGASQLAYIYVKNEVAAGNEDKVVYPYRFVMDTVTGRAALYHMSFKLYLCSTYVQRYLQTAWEDLYDIAKKLP